MTGTLTIAAVRILSKSVFKEATIKATNFPLLHAITSQSKKATTLGGSQ